MRIRIGVLIGCLVAFFFPTQAHATLFIILQTNDGYWLAIDSFRGDGQKKPEVVCKIHDTPFGLLIKGGASEGVRPDGEVYSTDQEVLDLLSKSTDSNSFQQALKKEWSDDIEDELIYLYATSKQTRQSLHDARFAVPLLKMIPIGRTRQVFLFEIPGGESNGRLLTVRPQSYMRPSSQKPNHPYIFGVSSDLPWHRLDDLFSVNQDTGERAADNPRQYFYEVKDRHDLAWIIQHPEPALLEMMAQANHEEPKTIGPPYVMVHVIKQKNGKNKVKWISKGTCPGWSTKLSGDEPLAALRTFIRQTQ